MNFTLTVTEFALLVAGAILLGIAIDLLISGVAHRKMKAKQDETMLEAEELKSKYAQDTESHQKEITLLQNQLQESEEKALVFSQQADELRQHNTGIEAAVELLEKKLKTSEAAEKETASQLTPVMGISGKADYFDQLLFAQSRLMDQNEKINQALSNLELLKDREEKQRQVMRDNAELAAQINILKTVLTEKEKEINSMKQKVHLTREMASLLDTAYGEFNTLQHTIKNLESKLNSSKLTNLEYEDIKEEYARLTKEAEEYRLINSRLTVENQQLHSELTGLKEKIKETEFHHQQLRKRVNYLTEMNADLRRVADANKKLEDQLRQIGKLETMLNDIAGEKNATAEAFNTGK